MALHVAPVARAEMLIRKPVSLVFEAFVDPAITSRFWFTRGSGRLEPGAEVVGEVAIVVSFVTREMSIRGARGAWRARKRRHPRSGGAETRSCDRMRSRRAALPTPVSTGSGSKGLSQSQRRPEYPWRLAQPR